VCQVCALYHRLVAKKNAGGLEPNESKDFEVCIAHRNVRDAQKSTSESQKKNLKERECFWLLDYGQNKSVKKKPEEDSFDFFNKKGISVIANVIFLIISGVLYKKICCFYSVYTTHNAQSTIDYFDRVLDYSILKNVNKIFLWSDGGGHFKNNDFIMHLEEKSLERNIQIQYNQFCEYEGKDMCDQFFGSLTNGLESFTKQKPVLDINDLLDFSKEHFKKKGTNEYTFEIYHPIRCERDENKFAYDHLDDFYSFNITNGETTAAVLTAQNHLPLKKKNNQNPKNNDH
jgi:hypothetical protein